MTTNDTAMEPPSETAPSVQNLEKLAKKPSSDKNSPKADSQVYHVEIGATSTGTNGASITDYPSQCYTDKHSKDTSKVSAKSDTSSTSEKNSDNNLSDDDNSDSRDTRRASYTKRDATTKAPTASESDDEPMSQTVAPTGKNSNQEDSSKQHQDDDDEMLDESNLQTETRSNTTPPTTVGADTAQPMDEDADPPPDAHRTKERYHYITLNGQIPSRSGDDTKDALEVQRQFNRLTSYAKSRFKDYPDSTHFETTGGRPINSALCIDQPLEFQKAVGWSWLTNTKTTTTKFRCVVIIQAIFPMMKIKADLLPYLRNNNFYLYLRAGESEEGFRRRVAAIPFIPHDTSNRQYIAYRLNHAMSEDLREQTEEFLEKHKVTHDYEFKLHAFSGTETISYQKGARGKAKTIQTQMLVL